MKMHENESNEQQVLKLVVFPVHSVNADCIKCQKKLKINKENPFIFKITIAFILFGDFLFVSVVFDYYLKKWNGVAVRAVVVNNEYAKKKIYCIL